MKARDVMTAPVVTVPPETSVSELAGLLVERRISAVPVVDRKGKILGIVGEGDLLRRAETGTERDSLVDRELDPVAGLDRLEKGRHRDSRRVARGVQWEIRHNAADRGYSHFPLRDASGRYGVPQCTDAAAEDIEPDGDVADTCRCERHHFRGVRHSLAPT